MKRFLRPIAVAAKRLRVERELACDDAVLIAGERPADYAEQLVEVAAELRSRTWRPAPVVAIAGASPIERRVRSILDPRVWRAPLDRWRTVGLSLGMAGLVLVVAALSPSVGEDQPASPVAEAGKERVLRFPGDRTMGVVCWRKSPAKPSDRLWMYGEEWHKVAEARGEVRMPLDGEVRLDISKSASTELSGLDSLQPDDIQGLNCRFTDVDDLGLRHIGRLSGLRMLDLRNTPITDADGRSFAGLKKLQWVSLDACGVNRKGFGVGDESLNTLARSPELESIWLRDTKVTDAGMAALAQAKSLTAVEVAGTKVSDTGMTYLQQLPNLDTLNLGLGASPEVGDNITDIGLATIGEMAKLRYLDLGGTRITDQGLSNLRNLSHLEGLTLERTKITEAGLAHLAPLHALQDLRLYLQSPVTDVGAAHLAKLKSLRRLTDNLDVTDRGVALLATLPNLEALEFHGKGVTDESARLVGQMKSLKLLQYQDCPITDKALASFSDLPNLELFRLFRTHVNGEGFRYLQKLPKLSILGIDYGSGNDQSQGLHPSLREIGKFRQIDDLQVGGDGLTNDDLKELAGMRQLKKLRIDFPVDDNGVGHLAGLLSLTSLIIENGSITDAGLKHISHLHRLNTLSIYGDFTDTGLEALAELKSLWGLSLGSKNVTEAGLQSLKRKLPALQVVQSLSPPYHPPTLDEQIAQAFNRPASALQRNRDAKEYARLADARVLITFADPQSPVSKKLFALYFDGDVSAAAYGDFRTLAIPTSAAKLAEAAALAKELGIELSNDDTPLVVAEGTDGKVLGLLKRSDLITKKNEIGQDALLAFVKQHVPPRLDGQKLFDDALAQAKRENKRVLAVETAVWCGPCHMLASFLNENHELWEKDYLWVKMDPRWPHAEEIMKSLRGDAKGGYPWFAILDSKGKVLAASNKSDGANIGFPNQPDEIAHFMQMIKRTAQRMTEEDLVGLKKALEGANH